MLPPIRGVACCCKCQIRQLHSGVAQGNAANCDGDVVEFSSVKVAKEVNAKHCQAC